MNKIFINGKNLTLQEIVNVARKHYQVSLTDEAIEAIKKSREYVDRLVKDGRVVYGITTGFGKFSDIHISKTEAGELQKNLITSHAHC